MHANLLKGKEDICRLKLRTAGARPPVTGSALARCVGGQGYLDERVGGLALAR